MMLPEDSRVPLYLLAMVASLLSLIAVAALLVSRERVAVLLHDPERATEWGLLCLLMLGAFATGAFVTYIFFV